MPESKSAPTAAPPSPSTELLALLDAIVADPEKWLATPSEQFGGRKPGELIGTPEERKLVDLLLAVDQGLF